MCPAHIARSHIEKNKASSSAPRTHSPTSLDRPHAQATHIGYIPMRLCERSYTALYYIYGPYSPPIAYIAMR
jgi:hypothetical protein